MGFFMDYSTLSPRPPRCVFWLMRPHKASNKVSKLCVMVDKVSDTTQLGKGKGKAEHLYSALHGKDHFKALRHGSHSFTCNKHHACLTS